ncbi:hypothetical protein N431DRAFT_465460 [Stipitochalara longipes BDJ]|nr:hypothetical protein N431DRAFT_465460 [Stipitochalara longipes BDJ]
MADKCHRCSGEFQCWINCELESGRKHINPDEQHLLRLQDCSQHCAPAKWIRIFTNDPRYQDSNDKCPWCEDPSSYVGLEAEMDFIYTPPGAPRESNLEVPMRIETPPRGWFSPITSTSSASGGERSREGSHDSHQARLSHSRPPSHSPIGSIGGSGMAASSGSQRGLFHHGDHNRGQDSIREGPIVTLPELTGRLEITSGPAGHQASGERRGSSQDRVNYHQGVDPRYSVPPTGILGTMGPSTQLPKGITRGPGRSKWEDPILQTDPRIQGLNKSIPYDRKCLSCTLKKSECDRGIPCKRCLNTAIATKSAADCQYPFFSPATVTAIADTAFSACRPCRRRVSEAKSSKSKLAWPPCDQRLPVCNNCCAKGLTLALKCTYSRPALEGTFRSQNSQQEPVVPDDSALITQGNMIYRPIQPQPGPGGQQQRQDHRYDKDWTIRQRQLYDQKYYDKEAGDFPHDYAVAAIHQAEHQSGMSGPLARSSAAQIGITEFPSGSRPSQAAPKRRQQDRRGSSSEKDLPAPKEKRGKKE